MLITVYQRRHGRFIPVKEYYQWRVPLADELDDVVVHGRGARGTSTRMACPGCGKIQARAVIRYDHMCPGDLTDRPANSMRYLKNRRWRPEFGEPAEEGAPVPTAREMRAIYNREINARVRERRTLAHLPEIVDQDLSGDYNEL